MKISKDNELFFKEKEPNSTYINNNQNIGFTKISNYIIYDYEISADALRIYTLIKNYTDREIPLTDAKIMHRLKLKNTYFYKYKKELLQRGYIDRKRLSNNKYQYIILDAPTTATKKDFQNMELLEFAEQMDKLEEKYLKRCAMTNAEKKDFEKAKATFLNIIKTKWLNN